MVVNDTKIPNKNGEIPQKSAITQALPQVLAASVKNVLLLGFGMTLGYPTILIPSFINGDATDSFILDSEQISWIGSVNLICVPVGCLLSGAVTQAIGRKRAMQLNNIPFLTAWLLFRFSSSVWQVFLALCITGLNGGLLEAPVLTYVAEITQPHLRGMLSSTSTMSVILGVLMQFLLGTFLHWRTVALVNCSVPVISFILLFFVPESPHWLIMKNRLSEARKSIAWLRGWTTVEAIDPEFKELCSHLGRELHGIDNPIFKGQGKKIVPAEDLAETSGMEKVKLFFRKTFLYPYGLVSFVFFLSNFGGTSTLQTYAVQIFATLKAPIDKYYATIFLGIAQLAGCVTCVAIIHYTGKRKLNFASLLACSVCYLVTATYAYVIDVEYLITDANTTRSNNESASAAEGDFRQYNWIPMTFLIASAFLSHVGIRVLPWILTGELYTNETRAVASGLSSAASYIFAFLANKVFFYMISVMTLPGTYWFYGALNLLGFVLLYFWLPETEGKTLHQITEHFAGRGKLGNEVFKKEEEEEEDKDEWRLVGTMNEGYIFSCAEGNGKYDHMESRL